MRRGDIVTVAAPGDYGKPRPAVVIPGDGLNRDARSTIVALMTSHLQDAPLLRLTVDRKSCLEPFFPSLARTHSPASNAASDDGGFAWRGGRPGRIIMTHAL